MQIAHKIELRPNNKQKTYFGKACGVSRFVYNWALAEWNKKYQDGLRPSGMQLKKEFNAIKKEQYPWTYEVTKYASQQPFLDLQDAFNRFFKKLAKGPQFKKKGRSRDSFYIGGDQAKIKGKQIHIPNLGSVRLKEHLRFSGKINSAVISRTADRWFASIQLEVDDKSAWIQMPENDRIIGIDLGINKLAVTSDGDAFEASKPLKTYLRKLKREQRVLSKKYQSAKRDGRALPSAKNFGKQKKKIQKIHQRVSNLRKDILHKLTTFFAANYSEIAIEDLNVKGMVKNHNLARHIHDVGFGEFRRQLTYKMGWRNTNLVLVDRFFPSSKKCSNPECGIKKNDLPLAERTFACECGLVLDRDYNASLNLKSQIGRVPSEFTPVEITAMRKSVHPIFVTSIVESGNKHQKLCG